MEIIDFTLPDKLEDLLRGNESLLSDIKPCIDSASKILLDNKLYFFPNYTDHGISHVEQVLATASKLVPDTVWEILSAADAACLILATLYHDLGMHITPIGFRKLISKSSDSDLSNNQGNSFNDQEWSDIWYLFIQEAKRFNDKDLVRIFGAQDDFNSGKGYSVREATEYEHDLTDSDRLLIGEFLRRHHPRLAQEIALDGFPGLPNSDFPRLGDILPQNYLRLDELVGIVARSHGMSMRVCADVITKLFPGQPRPEESLPVFHMALLRVADFLQLDAKRAPRILLHLRNPQSPTSIDEWNKQGAVRRLEWLHQDDEAILVELDHKHSLRTHLQVAELLEKAQDELDHASAVLSETYSSLAKYKLDKVRLQKTRVLSNIADATLLAKLPYVPEAITYSTSGADLISLLISPLYGDSPEIAIRELIQNSVDAVRELRILMSSRPEMQNAPSENTKEPDVSVSIEQRDGQWICEVIDSGIGMTLETVRDYFLRAGASIRVSDAWKNEFMANSDESHVLRSGRFGIGIFAAFLLGDTVEVISRNVANTHGLQFSSTLSSDIIEIRTVKDLPVGTRICVRLSKKVSEHFMKVQHEAWDWFSLSDVQVQRRYDGNVLPQTYNLPKCNKRLPLNWHRVRTNQFRDVHWTYSPAPSLVCNGLAIRDAKSDNTADLTWNASESMPLSVPRLSIFDPNGMLPLTLRRDSLRSNTVDFLPSLSREVVKDFLSYVLVYLPNKSEKFFQWCHKLNYPGLTDPHGIDRLKFGTATTSNRPPVVLDPWIVTSKGITLADQGLLNAYHPKRIRFVISEQYHDHAPRLRPPANSIVIGIKVDPEKGFDWSYPEDLVNLLVIGTKAEKHLGLFANYNILSWRAILPSDLSETLDHFSWLERELNEKAYEKARDAAFNEMARKKVFNEDLYSPEEVLNTEEILNTEEVTWNSLDQNFQMYKSTDFPESNDKANCIVEEIKQLAGSQWRGFVMDWYVSKSPIEVKNSYLSKIWIDLLGSPVIPRTARSRKKVISYAQTSLGKYLRAWEKISAKEAKKRYQQLHKKILQDDFRDLFDL